VTVNDLFDFPIDNYDTHIYRYSLDNGDSYVDYVSKLNLKAIGEYEIYIEYPDIFDVVLSDSILLTILPSISINPQIFTLTSQIDTIVKCSITNHDNDIFIGGLFNTVELSPNNIDAYSIAKYNRNGIWTNIATNDYVFNGLTINSIVCTSTDIFYVAAIQDLNSYIYKCDIDLIWILFATINNGIIYCMELDTSENIYIGGEFTTIDMTIGFNNIAKYDYTLGLWDNLEGGLTTVSGISSVRCIKKYSDNIFVGGRFNRNNTIILKNVAYWNDTVWTNFNNGFGNNNDTDIINTMLFDINSNLYIGGNFSVTVGSKVANCIAFWNGNIWTTYGDGVTDETGNITNAIVQSLVLDSSNILYIGGTFKNINKLNNLAYWNIVMSKWRSVGTGLLVEDNVPIINTMINKINDNDIFIGGYFDKTNILPLANLAVYHINTNILGKNISCFTEDTMILTPTGYINIKKLNIGDIVCTNDDRYVPIINIEINRVKATYHTFPYIIKPSSICLNYPLENIYLSAYHLIKYENKWFLPKYLGEQDKSKDIITYYHIMLPNYLTDNLIVNNGTIIESLCDEHNISHKNMWKIRYHNAVKNSKKILLK
jgi:hypothetical protein